MACGKVKYSLCYLVYYIMCCIHQHVTSLALSKRNKLKLKHYKSI